jgi:hypothetical protein
MYRCETWSLPLRDKHRPRVFKNRVLRRIFGPTRVEVIWKDIYIYDIVIVVSICTDNALLKMIALTTVFINHTGRWLESYITN